MDGPPMLGLENLDEMVHDFADRVTVEHGVPPVAVCVTAVVYRKTGTSIELMAMLPYQEAGY